MYIIKGADGQDYGPVSAEQVRQWMAEGRANAQTSVRREGTNEWKPLGEFPELALNAPAAGAAVAPGPLSAPAPFPVAATPRTNPLAVTGLVLGILSVTIACCCYGLPFNVAGVVFSIVALAQISRDPVNQRGKGMAMAGLVLSVLSILLAGLVFLLGLASNWSDIMRRFPKL